MENSLIIQIVTAAVSGLFTYLIAKAKVKPEIKKGKTDHTEVLFNQYITTIQSLNNRVGMLEEKLNRIEREREEEIKAYKDEIGELEDIAKMLEDKTDDDAREIRSLKATIEEMEEQLVEQDMEISDLLKNKLAGDVK